MSDQLCTHAEKGEYGPPMVFSPVSLCCYFDSLTSIVCNFQLHKKLMIMEILEHNWTEDFKNIEIFVSFFSSWTYS